MWAKIGRGLYALGALWLAAIVAYLVYLLLPFGIGLLSSGFAALVAVLVLIALARRWLGPWFRGQPVGLWRVITVSILALATFVLDAGRSHYLVPFLPTDQDACSFGSIGLQQYRALEREMAAKLDPDWSAIVLVRGAEQAFEERMAALVPDGPSDQVIARMHAIARALGAQFDGGEARRRAPSGGDYHMRASYGYKFDLNRTIVLRRPLFRWARVGFQVVQPRSDGAEVHVELAYLHLPSFKSSNLGPPRKRSCPPLPAVG